MDPFRRSWSMAAIAVVAALMLGGCGSDGGPSRSVQEDPAKPKGPFIATLGDSIVAGSPQWDPDPETRKGLQGVDEDSQWQRWVTGDDELRNCGVWGERTDQIGLRYRDCTDGATAVVVQGGINDIVGQRDVRNAAMDLGCIVDQAIADDLPVAIANVLPWNNGDARAAKDIRELNVLIAEIARERGIPVLPFYETLDDPKAPGRMPVALTVEGDHPNVAGYRLLGERAWREPVLGTPVTAHRDGDCSHLDLD